MKRLLVFGQYLILLCTIAGYLYETKEERQNHPLSGIFSDFHGAYLDLKLNLRKPELPKSKIVVVTIDDASIEQIGRWPWPRDAITFLLETILKNQPAAIGLDMVFSEREFIARPEFVEALGQAKHDPKNLERLLDLFDNDRILEKTIQKNSSQIVLGWAAETCPYYLHPDFCREGTFTSKDLDTNTTIGEIPKGTVFTIVNPVFNLPRFEKAAKYSGFFNAWSDADGVIRKAYSTLTGVGGTYPSLSLAMKQAGRGARQSTEPTSFYINFKGERFSFPEVSALDVLSEEAEIPVHRLNENGEMRNNRLPRKAVFENAYVLVGISATAGGDLHTFPLDKETPGVIGHAWSLENLLTENVLRQESAAQTAWVVLFILILFIAWSYGARRVSAWLAVTSIFAVTLFVFIVDQWVLFAGDRHWHLQFFYAGFSTLGLWTLVFQYVEKEREKKFVETAFGKYLSPKVVQSILEDPKSLELGGLKTELSIMFIDIRNFTELSERLDPKVLTGFINRFFERMTSIAVDRFDGTLDKFMGDALMFFWGAPTPQAHHALLACQAAIEMQKEVQRFAAEIEKEFHFKLATGIGIATGTVNVGNMGSEKARYYTVIGDTVNLASRLEGATKTYGVSILASRTTVERIENLQMPLPDFRAIDLLVVKGKKEPVEIVEIFTNAPSPEGLQVFNEARKLYRQRKCNDALLLFSKSKFLLQSEKGEDRASLLYIERCKHYLESPPPENWDGSFEMKSK